MLHESVHLRSMSLMSRLYSLFFSLGQTLPINRHPPFWPRGISQPSMNHAVTLLNQPYNCWVHIFPEARVYQAPNLTMRYFKTGISRLILEPNKMPIVIPMFHAGMETVMREYQVPPQFFPSIGKNIHVRFGDPIPFKILNRLHRKWEEVKEHPTKRGLRALRIETAETVRDAVNQVRSSMGYPPEPPNSNDPKLFPPITPARKEVKRWFTRLGRDK
jgi:1-acyl-sn-glycerol-3-phosphate acyltransferase